MCIGLLALLLFPRVYNVSQIEQVRLIGFDSKIQSIPETQSDQIVLLNIGEKSLEKYGQWPWPRRSR